MTKSWPKHMGTIHELYVKQGKTLKDTKKIMESQYGFNASTRAYRKRFQDLGWSKYIKKQQRSENRPRPRLRGVDLPSQAPLMTPGPSSEGNSGMSGPTLARAVSGPSPSSHALYSPETGYSSQGGGSPSSSTLGTPAHPHHHASAQTYVQLDQQTPRAVQSAQRSSGAFCYSGAYGQPQQQQQQQQPLPSYRPILPAQQQHHGQHPSLRIETTGATDLSVYHAFISPALSVSSPVQPFEQVNAMRNSQLNHRSPFGNGHHLTPFEQYIQEFVSREKRGSQVSRKDILDFCKGCADFVRHTADASRVVPRDLEQTFRMAVDSPDARAVVQNAGLHHQLQLQRAQQDLGFVVPLWVSVWVLACQQGLHGNLAALDVHLQTLLYLLNRPIDIHELKDLLFLLMMSARSQQPDHNVWNQQ